MEHRKRTFLGFSQRENAALPAVFARKKCQNPYITHLNVVKSKLQMAVEQLSLVFESLVQSGLLPSSGLDQDQH